MSDSGKGEEGIQTNEINIIKDEEHAEKEIIASDSESDGEMRHINSLGRGGKFPIKHAKDIDASLSATIEEEKEQLKNLETNRVSFYDRLLDQNITQWEHFKKMLQESKEEQDLLEFWLVKRMKCLKAYAISLCSSNDKIAGLKKGTTKKFIHDDRMVPEGKAVKKRSILLKGAAGGQDGNGDFLDELCAMDYNHSKKIIQHIKDIETTILSELKNEQSKIITSAKQCVDKGNKCMSALKNIDQHVYSTYSVYLSNVARLEAGKASASNAKICEDIWLADMRYRVAAYQQKAAWRGSLGFMKRIFNEMIDHELSKRAASKKALESLFDAESSLFGKAPECFENVQRCMQRLCVTASELKEELTQTKNIIFGHEKEDGELEFEMGDLSFIDKVSHPTESPFIRDSAVLLRKAKSRLKKSVLVPSLVILTAEYHLHMFDCKEVTPGCTPKEAFDSIVPYVEISDYIKLKAKDVRKRSEVKPTVTLHLKSFIAGERRKQKKTHHATFFHVVEIRENAGLKQKFKKESQTKVSLCAKDDRECAEWLSKLENIAKED